MACGSSQLRVELEEYVSAQSIPEVVYELTFRVSATIAIDEEKQLLKLVNYHYIAAKTLHGKLLRADLLPSHLLPEPKKFAEKNEMTACNHTPDDFNSLGEVWFEGPLFFHFDSDKSVHHENFGIHANTFLTNLNLRE